MVCSYIFVSEIMKMCKEKKVYENIEKVAFYHNGSCCFSYAGIWCTGCASIVSKGVASSVVRIYFPSYESLSSCI